MIVQGLLSSFSLRTERQPSQGYGLRPSRSSGLRRKVQNWELFENRRFEEDLTSDSSSKAIRQSSHEFRSTTSLVFLL